MKAINWSKLDDHVIYGSIIMSGIWTSFSMVGALHRQTIVFGGCIIALIGVSVFDFVYLIIRRLQLNYQWRQFKKADAQFYADLKILEQQTAKAAYKINVLKRQAVKLNHRIQTTNDSGQKTILNQQLNSKVAVIHYNLMQIEHWQNQFIQTHQFDPAQQNQPRN